MARYWAEFAQQGKQDVLVRHVLSHTSGLPGWDEPVTLDDVLGVPKSTALLAAQPSWWQPGTASGDHSFTYGHLIGELVRRVTGKSLTGFIAEEIAEPLGADFQLGAREEDWARVSDVVPPPPGGSPPVVEKGTVRHRVFVDPGPNARWANLDKWKRAEMGAGNGHTNPRALARILSVISRSGETGLGQRFLSPETVELIFREQANGEHLVLGVPLRFGIGFGLAGQGALPI